MNILILLPHRLMVRNWITSGAAGFLTQRGHTVTVCLHQRNWYDLPTTLRQRLIPIFLDSLGVGRFRERVRSALRLGSMVAREEGSTTYQHKLGQRRPLVGRLEIAAWRRYRARVSGGPDGGPMEERLRGLEGRFRPRRAARETIRAIQPDVLLWATLIHQDNEELEIVKACRALGVPIVAAPASWDNLSSKGGFMVRPDQMLVWGEESAAHAAQWHNCPPGKIHVTGPPHWDGYARIATGKARPAILVAGTSVNYWEDEHACLVRLGQNGQRQGYRVLYRPHPRGAWGWQRSDQMPPGVARDPMTSQQVCLDRPGWSLHPDDLRDYPALIASVQAVVAAFSTLTIEAALLGKTPIMVGYGRTRHGPGMSAIHSAYEHMAHVVNWPGVKVAYSAEDLVRFVQNAVQGRYAPYAAGLRQMALRVAKVDGRARECIAAALEATVS